MRTILCTLFALAGMTVYGQQNFASISFGVSNPLGDYSQSGDLASSGYARTGGAIKFDAGYFPTSYLGIGASFSFNNNYGMRDSILKDVVLYLEENASNPIDIPHDAEIEYGSGFWNNIGLYLGPHFSARLSQRFYADLRILGGASILRPPDQELFIIFDGTEIHNRTSDHKISFGFTTGAAFRFRLNEDLALRLAVDYFQSRARFNYTFQIVEGVAEEIPPLETDFLVRSLDLLVGLAYAF